MKRENRSLILLTPRVLLVLVALSVLTIVGSSFAIKAASGALDGFASPQVVVQEPTYTKTVKQSLSANLGTKGVITSGTVETVTEVTTHEQEGVASNVRTVEAL